MVRVKAVPGASSTKLSGVLEDRLKIRVAAPPEKGKANAALCALLAGALGVGKGAVSVVSGAGSPTKAILVEGIDPDEVARRLARARDG